MIPIGYMLKKVVPTPTWLSAPHVKFVYSVSACISDDFLDYIPLWKHNGWWLFDSPSALEALAVDNHCNRGELTLFYFEAFEKEYDAEKKAWVPLMPKADFRANVEIPDYKILRGYDVVTFRAHTSPEHSPLSCNSLASTIRTNQYCLLDDIQGAYDLAEQARLHKCEAGPYRIISVYAVG